MKIPGVKWSLLLFGMLVLLLPRPVRAQDVQNFSFQSFNAQYYLSKQADGSSRLDVKENLLAVFPDFDQNHGILRAIPERYQGHTLSLRILSVTNTAGTPY